MSCWTTYPSLLLSKACLISEQFIYSWRALSNQTVPYQAKDYNCKKFNLVSFVNTSQLPIVLSAVTETFFWESVSNQIAFHGPGQRRPDIPSNTTLKNILFRKAAITTFWEKKDKMTKRQKRELNIVMFFRIICFYISLNGKHCIL